MPMAEAIWETAGDKKFSELLAAIRVGRAEKVDQSKTTVLLA